MYSSRSTKAVHEKRPAKSGFAQRLYQWFWRGCFGPGMVPMSRKPEAIMPAASSSRSG